MTSSKMWKFSIQYQSDLDLKSWLNEAQESSGIKRNQLWYKNRGHLTKEQNLVNEKLIEIYNKINKSEKFEKNVELLSTLNCKRSSLRSQR